MRGRLFGKNQMCRGVRGRMVVVVRSSFSIIEMGARGYFKLVPYRSGFWFFLFLSFSFFGCLSLCISLFCFNPIL